MSPEVRKSGSQKPKAESRKWKVRKRGSGKVNADPDSYRDGMRDVEVRPKFVVGKKGR